jgi:hypothetical protein
MVGVAFGCGNRGRDGLTRSWEHGSLSRGVGREMGPVPQGAVDATVGRVWKPVGNARAWEL